MIRLIIFLTASLYIIKSHGQTIDKATQDSLRAVLCKMSSEDQRVRSENVDIKTRKRIDSIQFSQLTQITRKFGYPDKKRIGDENCSNDLFIILSHNTDRLHERENFELYISECRKGNIDSWELGHALDRYFVQFFKKSMYGLYGPEKPCIEDMETVNNNRRMLNLRDLRKEEFKTCH